MTSKPDMSSVLVTGASGFIGTRLVGRLVQRGVRVHALDILPPRERLAGVEYHQLDVRQPIPLELGKGVDAIYNFAAVHRTPGHPAHEYYDTNLNGAFNVTALAAANDVGTILFTSSISVYGPSEEILDEQSPLKPVSDYGRSKRMAELIHEAWAECEAGRRLVVVRPGVVFGPGERGNYSHLAKALRRGMFAYPGRRDAIKSGGYVDELLATMEFALARPDPYILYNFAYPDPSTTEDIVETFGRVTGRSSRPVTIPLAPMLIAASAFEVAAAVGVKTPIHRERVMKLVQSTKIAPGWLSAQDYRFGSDLETALTHWRDQTSGTFA
jgi:GlcNAc-P-P-Und epimerase